MAAGPLSMSSRMASNAAALDPILSGHITFLDKNPRVLQGIIRRGAERPAIRIDHCRNELGYHHKCLSRQDIESRPQGEAHAESPDEDARPGQGCAPGGTPERRGRPPEPCARLDIRV